MRKFSNKEIQKLQVSSVVRNDKSFGKQNMFDGSDDTCWSSDMGSPQWIRLELKEAVPISGFAIQFQGGFVGQNCRVEWKKGEEVFCECFYPEDINSVQKFSLTKPVICKQIKFVFGGSTDFFGRVVVYSIDFVSE